MIISINKKLFPILGLLFLLSCQHKQEKTKAKINTITESVYASGIVKAKQQYYLYPSVSGVLKKKYVSPGEQVTVNQDLFLIENNISLLNTENAELAYALAKENAASNSTVINDLKINLEQAADKLTYDSSLYFRQKSLWGQNVGTRNELDQKNLAYLSSLKSYKAALNKLKQTKIQLQNEVQRAKNNLLIGQKQTHDYTIKSELNGKVYDVLKEEGELVNAQNPLAILGEANHFVLEFQVDEFDIIKIKTGQLVKFTMDSYNGKIFDAYITQVYPIMNESSRTFKVEAEFKDAPEKLYPNLTAEANIIIQTKNKALTIPSAYLIEGQYVLVNKTHKKPIKIGLKDYQHVEIISGLDSSEYIYLPKE